MTTSSSSSSLFTGESAASRGFELAILAAAAVLVTHTLALPPADAPSPSLTGPAGGAVAAVAIALIALAGVFPIPLGHKVYLSLGSGAAFAALLVFPPREALPLAFGGMLIAQVIRRGRGSRLTPSTILFNQMQYLVTWTLAAAFYLRTQSDVGAYPAMAWLPVAAAGAVYMLVNTWIVTTWAALRKRTWTWDLWMRGLREAGLEYAVSLFLGAVVASLVVVHPALVLPVVFGVALVQRILSHLSRFQLRQVSAALAALVEFAERRSPHTAEHSERVSWWAERLARQLGLPQDEVEEVAIAAKLHDLGKTALHKDLEEKPGPLSEDEWLVMRRHPAIGADIIQRLPGLGAVARCVRYHHERYDGQGYPEGLGGEAIPLGARIITVADSFDAMLGVRPYRPAMTHEAVLAQIAAGAGTQFDPGVAAALLALVRSEDSRGEITRALSRTPALAFAAAGGEDGGAGLEPRGRDGARITAELPLDRPDMARPKTPYGKHPNGTLH